MSTATRLNPLTLEGEQRVTWLRDWRTLLGYTVKQGAKRLQLSEARFKDNIYNPTRPASDRTLKLAIRVLTDTRRLANKAARISA